MPTGLSAPGTWSVTAPFPTGSRRFSGSTRFPLSGGNHDRWALERGPGGRDEFGGGTPSTTTLLYLQTLPFDVLVAHERTVAVVVHASPRSDMEFVTYRSHPPRVLRGYLSDLDCNLLVVGHTHRPMWFRCSEGLVVNPGSVVSMPVVDSSRTFAVVDLENLEPTFHDVESGRVIEVEPWE